MKKLIFIFIFSFATGLAQNLGNLFKNYLPNDVKLKDSLIIQAGAPLKAYAEINPDLIYYYIKYLEAKFKESSSDKYFLDNFNKIICRYRTQYLTWINSLIGEIKSKDIDKQLMNECMNYIDSYSFSISGDTCIDPFPKTNFSLLNFFVVKYYSNDTSLTYSTFIDYKAIRDSLELLKSSPLNDMLNNPLAYTKDDLKILFDNWFIYSESNTFRSLSSAIIDVMREYLLNDRLYGNLTFSLGLSNLRNNITIPGNLYDSPDFALPDSEQVYNNQTITLSLNYKLFLSRYILPFSYLNAQLSFGYSFVNKSFKEDSLYRMANVEGVPNRNKIMIFSQNDVKMKSAEYFSLNLSTPIFYIRHRFSIDVGAGMAIFINNYDLNYSYTYRKFDSNFYAPVVLEEYNSGPITKNKTSSHFTYYPLLNIKFYLNRSFLLELSASNKIVSLDAGLNL